MSDLALNDPVHVERESQKLEGIIAYMGPVQFSEGDDWVGVRLTGTSIGLGKNDGTVKGERYFHCSPNSGVFVRMSSLSKRTLSKLELLRLKRELATGNAGITRGAAAPSPLTPSDTSSIPPPSSSRTPVKKDIASPRPLSSASLPETTSTTAQKTKLEELRERRAALDAAKSASSQLSSKAGSPAVMESATSQEVVVDPRDAKIVSLQEQLKDMQKLWSESAEKLKFKEEENASLQQSLSKAEHDLHDANAKEEEAKSAGPPIVTIGVTDAALQEALEQANEELHQLKQELKDLRDHFEQTKMELSSVKIDLDKEREGRATNVDELTKTKSELSALQYEIQAMSDQVNVRSSSDATHYKERAKLQAELSAMKRTIETIEAEKVEMEGNIEDLTLDKEQLLEEKEALQDRLEEIKIDAETVQMEMEELRMELEDVKSRESNADGMGQLVASTDSDDAMQTLSIQNGRLREALIRLREQSSIEKMAMSKELRAAEKAASEGNALISEVENLRSQNKVLQTQIADLKDMVEEGSAFESMVEDLSDRVMALEDDNVALQSTIRELEEAGDIASEMEEVQADENKALMRDVESRDAIIRNLEEAIRMQRRREEDFQRTVGNYRNTVETLKQEKNQLLALQRGGEGEKSDLLATSQKALSRAAHLVSDTANARKREAEAALIEIDCQMQRHLADRLESFLPQVVVGPELAAVRGELLLSSVLGKASKSLEGIGSIFSQAIRAGIGETISESGNKGDSQTVLLSDDAAQGIQTMVHQSEYAVTIINVSSELIRILTAGQWPDLLSVEDSAELGAILSHSLADIDAAMGNTLKCLKEEGVLSPHRSNLGAFHQSALTTIQALNSSFERDGKSLIPVDWSPPALQLFKQVATAKFLCFGAGAVVSSAVSPYDLTVSSGSSAAVSADTKAVLRHLMTKLDQISGEASKMGPRLSRLDVKNEKIVNEIEGVATEWMSASQVMLTNVKTLFASKTEINVTNVTVCEAAADVVIKALSQLSSSLRAADLNAEDEAVCHPFASEAKDPWNGIARLAQAVRAIDGDSDDVHFIVRAQSAEQRFTEAIENIPKLTIANNKIATLEKTLSTRSKEVAMQNARLSELEKVLTKSNAQTIQIAQTSADASSVEELVNLKEENRVLTEAMDVLQQQVDEYENELRAAKDPKSPMRRGTTTPRKGGSVLFSPGRSTRGLDDVSGSADVSPASVAALEAAFYRPALVSAHREASNWKAKAMSSSIMDLPPLYVPRASSSFGENKEEEKDHNPLADLEAAMSELRLARASVTIVDLTKPSPRAHYFDSMAKTAAAEQRLKKAAVTANQWISQSGASVPLPVATDVLLGRLKFPGISQLSTTLSLKVTTDDLNRMQTLMLK